jgi:Rrf2 family protein
MQQLVRAGILKGVRGPRGGYRLARERRRVTVGEIIRVVEGVRDTEEAVFNSDSELGTKVMTELWEDIATDIIAKLDAVTIHDLCEKAEQRNVRDKDRGDVARAPSFVI